MTVINIAGRPVGDDQPCFIIAEAGVNHNGDIYLAEKLVGAARDAGADAVKFQTFRTEDLVVRNAGKAEYQKKTTRAEESQFEMLKKLELGEKDFTHLFALAGEHRIIFLSTPFDKGSIDILDNLGVAAFKIGSGHITGFPLLQHIAAKRKPVILSTGMAIIEEIDSALRVLKSAGAADIILLHCVSSYPARIEDTNLKVMETLKVRFRLPVGLSDHSPGITVPVAAVALGACVIEKHLTLDKNLPGPDHRASLEPHEFKQMVMAIRDAEKALGNGVKKLTPDEEKNRKVGRRVIVAAVDIPRGTVITGEMLDAKRAGEGIEPRYIDKIVGSNAIVDINRDEIINIDKINQDISE